MSVDRPKQPVKVRTNSLIFLAVGEPMFLDVIKPLVIQEFHSKEMKIEEGLCVKPRRGYKFSLTPERRFESEWEVKKKVAMLSAYRKAASGLGLVDEFGIPATRNWCKSMLNLLISRYFRKVGDPIYEVKQNSQYQPELGFYCELSLNKMDPEDAPFVRSDSFLRKKEAMNDAAYRALCLWRCDKLIDDIDNDSNSDIQVSQDSSTESASKDVKC